MFTGIIENLGKLEKTNGVAFVFSAELDFCNKLKKGTSVSINGVCLTVVKKPNKKSFLVEIMPETQEKTMLGKLKPKDIVNFELPATVNTFLSGHVVQGHVDGVGTVQTIEKDGNSHLLKIKTPSDVLEFVVKKGSVAINGISFTIISVDKKFFTVGIIPFTWEKTMLHNIKIGDSINIETDVLGKYLKKFLGK